MPYDKQQLPCDLCKGVGQLWLRGADYFECPHCGGDGTTELIVERVQAVTKERYVARAGGGLTKTTLIVLPHGGTLEHRHGDT